MDDFIREIRDEKILRTYYTVQTRQTPGGSPLPQLSSYMIFTAKTNDDKKLFILPLLLKAAEVPNEESAKAFYAEVGKLLSGVIEQFQTTYPSCRLTDGAVE